MVFNSTGILIRRENLGAQRNTRDTHAQRGKIMQRYQGKAAIHKPKREPSGETSPMTP